MDQDKSLTCSDCGAEFVFTAKDQAYYSERGFVPPKRCKVCRENKKTQGGGGGGGRGPRSGGGGAQSAHFGGGSSGGGGGYSGGGGGGYGGGDRASRPLFDAVCAACGQPTKVPFRPASGRPVYCRDCYREQGAGGRGGR